ncbi:MAG: dihydroneopterin aldolase [Prevotella sp.]|nr:dihydroneopterin aldolase [Prevotella sp.]
MKILSSHISLKNVRFHARHGVMSLERTVGADFTVNLTVSTDLSKAADSDNVDDTVNYAILYDILHEEMNIPSQLLEHVAARVARRILERFSHVKTVDIEITKCNPPMQADCDGAAVRMVFEQSSLGKA